MACTFVQVGQCGNQLGQTLWLPSESHSTFFREGSSRFARSVCVDTEPKVVAKLREKGSIHNPDNVISSYSGCGNNWAMGYFGNRESREVLERALERIRHEAENCDRFASIMLFHSAAGGTGSGMGSKLLEETRTMFPSAYITSAMVLPMLSGEIAVQYYNTLFTTAHAQQFSDCVIALDNHSIAQSLGKSAAIKGTKPTPSNMKDWNASMSWALAGLLLPVSQRKRSKLSYIPFDMGEAITCVCPDPATKFVEAWSSATPGLLQDNLSAWEKHASAMSSVAGMRDLRGRAIQTSLAQFTVRGEDAPDARRVSAVAIKKAFKGVEWNPFVEDWRVVHPPKSGARFMSMLSNRSRISSVLQYVMNRSRSMYDAKAYVHHYVRHGADAEIFSHAFETVQQVIDSYEIWYR